MSVKDRIYYSNNYGFLHKLNNAWKKLLDIIRGLSILISFFLIPISLCGIVYYVFVCYDFLYFITFTIMLWIVIDSNKKL